MRQAWIMLVFFAALATACTQVEEVPITDWVQHHSFPGTPRASASAFVIDDSAYLCCGRTDWHRGYLNEVWKYDSQSDTWSQLDSFPGKRRVKAVAVSIDGKGYVGMGCDGGIGTDEIVVYRDFYEFDPATRTWTQKASFPGPEANDLSYAVVNGRLYTAMGFDGRKAYPSTYQYDPQTDTWTKLTDAEHAYLLTSSFAIDDQFYVGAGCQGRNIRTVFRYDTTRDRWSQVASMPQGRMLSNGLAIGDKGYFLLGRFWAGVENGGHLLSDIIEYDPTTNAWTKRGDFAGQARQNATVFNIRGRGYVVMGENVNPQTLNDVWSFKP